VEFGASYSVPRNTATQRGFKKQEFSTGSIFPDLIQIVEFLWKEVTHRVETKISNDLGFNNKMVGFARLKEAVAGLKIPEKGPKQVV